MTTTATTTATMESQLDPIFESAIKSGRVPGVAAVALNKDGSTIFSKGYGNITVGDESSPLVSPSTPALIWSCTKVFACVAALQLLEANKMELNEPAEKYCPAIKDLKVLKGWNEDGSPILEESENPITILHLFTHTSGMAYDWLDANILHWRTYKEDQPAQYMSRCTMEDFGTPLVSEPGTRYNYGTSIDFLGMIVERISGLPLDQYVDKHIIQPLDLKNTGRALDDEQSKNFLKVHLKDAEAKLTATELRMNPEPPILTGGGYLYSSTDDYATLLCALLNDGTHPLSGVQILKPETVREYVFKDHLPCSADGIGEFATTIPQLACSGTMLPGIRKGWSLAGLINHAAAPKGRSKGSLAWAGFGNCYFWVDPEAGKLGFVVAAVLPFFDRDVLVLADALERAVYGHEMPGEIGEKGSNFEGGLYRA